MGNIEYLKDDYNCLFYEQGDINDALRKIEILSTDNKLREKLIKNGLETAKKRDWKVIEEEIIKLYE